MCSDFRVVLKQAALALALSAMGSQAFGAGALAIDGHRGQFGFVHDTGNVAQAEQQALQDCGTGCQVVLRFENGCAAFAADQSGESKAYGWGALKTSSAAETRAMAACEARGGKSCKIQSSGCNRS